jgi:hypothetical protein
MARKILSAESIAWLPFSIQSFVAHMPESIIELPPPKPCRQAAVSVLCTSYVNALRRDTDLENTGC